ncbi:PQQ-binding-like beta-propeller repeat protein [Trujillonella humicola]|uniref:outer membrane protein assembly factor BamB family protein n=1 Tax=Trujillonella humicola TaxID=3383699 RepID=UPI003905B36A
MLVPRSAGRRAALGPAVLAMGLLAGCGSSGDDDAGSAGGPVDAVTPSAGPAVAFDDLRPAGAGGAETTDFPLVAGPGTTVLVPQSSGVSLVVSAVDYTSGETAWQRELPGTDPAGYLGCRTTPDAATAFCLAHTAADENRLLTLDAATGEVRSDVPVAAGLLDAVTDSGVVVRDRSIDPDRASSVDPATGEIRWSLDLDDAAGIPVVQHEDVLFFGELPEGEADQSTVMVTADTGATIAEFSGRVTVQGDTALRADEAAGLVAAVGPDGSDRWQLTGAAGPECRVGSAPSGVVFLQHDGGLTAVDPADGTIRWSRPAAAAEQVIPLLDSVLAPDAEGNLYLVDPGTGETLGAVYLDGDVVATPPCGSPHLLVASRSGVTAHSGTGGWPAWEVTHPPGWSAEEAEFLLTDGATVVRSESGFYALISD